MKVTLTHETLKYIKICCSAFLLLFICSCTEKVSNDKSYKDFDDDPSYPAINKELIFSIKGDTVSGYAFIANDSTLKETIILVQGYPGNDNNFDLAQSLRRNGKNVIHFNHRGAWGSQGTYTYLNCLEDIDYVIEYLSEPKVLKQLRIDINQFSLVGRSYGGGISLIQGSIHPRIQKIVAISSVNYGTLMEKYNDLEELSGFKNYMKKQVMINSDIDFFLQELLDNKEKFNVLSYQELLNRKNVLIIEDSDKNDHWISQLSNAKVIKLESGHNFISKRIKMIDEIIKWFNKE